MASKHKHRMEVSIIFILVFLFACTDNSFRGYSVQNKTKKEWYDRLSQQRRMIKLYSQNELDTIVLLERTVSFRNLEQTLFANIQEAVR